MSGINMRFYHDVIDCDEHCSTSHATFHKRFHAQDLLLKTRILPLKYACNRKCWWCCMRKLKRRISSKTRTSWLLEFRRQLAGKARLWICKCRDPFECYTVWDCHFRVCEWEVLVHGTQPRASILWRLRNVSLDRSLTEIRAVKHPSWRASPAIRLIDWEINTSR